MSDTATPAAAPAPSAAPAPTPTAPPASNTSGQAKQPDSPPANQAAEVRRLKAKIDGAEREITEEEAVNAYQKVSAADKRFEEAAKMRKEKELFDRALETGDHQLLLKVPPEARRKLMRNLVANDPETAAELEDYIVEQLRYEQMSPEQQRAYQIEQENRQYKARDAQAQKVREAQEQQRLSQHYQQVFPQALEAHGIPNTRYALSRMAYHTQMALRAGEKVTYRELAARVREEYDAEESGRYEALDGEHLVKHLSKTQLKKLNPEQLEALLGDDGMSKLREHLIAKVRPKTPGVTPPRGPDGKFQPKDEPKRKSLEEVRRELEESRFNRR